VLHKTSDTLYQNTFSLSFGMIDGRMDGEELMRVGKERGMASSVFGEHEVWRKTGVMPHCTFGCTHTHFNDT